MRRTLFPYPRMATQAQQLSLPSSDDVVPPTTTATDTDHHSSPPTLPTIETKPHLGQRHKGTTLSLFSKHRYGFQSYRQLMEETSHNR